MCNVFVLPLVFSLFNVYVVISPSIVHCVVALLDHAKGETDRFFFSGMKYILNYV